MKSNFRGFLTMLLAVVLVMAGSPFNVSAEETEMIYKEVIAPQYDDARYFSEGLAPVKKNGKWGYINEAGEVVIDFQYDGAHSFSEGKALVEKLEDMDGYFMRCYHIITPDNKSTPLGFDQREYCGFDVEFHNSTFYNGYIIVPADTPTGRFVFNQYGQAFDDSAYLPTEGLLGKGNHYTDLDDDQYVVLYGDLGFVNTAPFNQGMAPVLFEDSNDEKGYYYTFLNKDGTFWSGPKFYNYYVYDIYKSYQVFNDNALASLMNADGKWGAVNKAGETIIPFQYEALKAFTDGVAAFSKSGKWGFVDIHGNEVLKPRFDDTSGFANGLAVVREGNTARVIDRKGNTVKGSEKIPKESYFTEDGYEENGEVRNVVTNVEESIIIKENGKYGFAELDYQEKVVNVTGVSLNEENVTLEKGQESRLMPTISPMDATNKNVTWSSSNDKVATVNNYGVVTAKSPGTVIITVTTEDGAHIATTNVTVPKPNPYENYQTWGDALTNSSAQHNWTIKLSMPVDEKTVNNSNVYIVDKDYNKLSIIQPKIDTKAADDSIILTNNGSFNIDEDYWIIIEDSVKSVDGKKLGKGLKAKFSIK